MAILNDKNQYFAVGIVKKIDAITEREYTDRNGEVRVWKSRMFVIRNKYRKNNRWWVTDYPFEGTGSVIDALALVEPGQEVIVSFSIKSYEYEYNGETRNKVTLSAWNLLVMREKPVKPEWWNDKNGDFVKGKFEHSKLPSHQDKINRRPDNKQYSYDAFSSLEDYSEEDDDEEIPF